MKSLCDFSNESAGSKVSQLEDYVCPEWIKDSITQLS